MMPPKKTDFSETPTAEPVAEEGQVLDDAPHPLPSGGGCYVVEAGELKQSQAPTRDPRSASDPV
jgi:hypothetical protein